MEADQRGLTLTTESAAAAAAYRTAVDRYFEYRLDTMKHLKAALEADPEFAMAHCLQGYLFMLFGTNTVLDKARAAQAFCGERRGAVSPREASHIDALGAWVGGDIEGAVAVWDRILFDHPLDLLALRLQHFALFWLGRSRALCGNVARVAEAWSDDLPGYGNVLGMLAFGLEECGEYAAAEAHGRRAVEDNVEDLWAVHAVAHVLEMQGRRQEGLLWLDYPADRWDDRNPFRGHLWWHKALFALELGRTDQVLSLYDRSIRSDAFQFYLDVQNAAALLLRLEFQGTEVGDRWGELADHAETALDDHVILFTDLHNLMALAHEGREAAAANLLQSLRQFGEAAGNGTAATVDAVILPVGRAILDYFAGNHPAVVERLLPIRHQLMPMGASHAQRDIFAQMLVESALRAGLWPIARGLLSERLTWGNPGVGTWLKYAEVLEGQGDTVGAGVARQRAGEIGHA